MFDRFSFVIVLGMTIYCVIGGCYICVYIHTDTFYCFFFFSFVEFILVCHSMHSSATVPCTCTYYVMKL